VVAFAWKVEARAPAARVRLQVSDAKVAEVPLTAVASRPKADQVHARLIVRRVRDANPAHRIADAQAELSRPGATTRCSPTRPSRRSKQKPITVGTARACLINAWSRR